MILRLKQEKLLLPESAKVTKWVKPAIWGAVGGAVAFTVIEFSSLGWTLGSTAERTVTQRVETAVS
jgi:hypothetical protein